MKSNRSVVQFVGALIFCALMGATPAHALPANAIEANCVIQGPTDKYSSVFIRQGFDNPQGVKNEFISLIYRQPDFGVGPTVDYYMLVNVKSARVVVLGQGIVPLAQWTQWDDMDSEIEAIIAAGASSLQDVVDQLDVTAHKMWVMNDEDSLLLCARGGIYY